MSLLDRWLGLPETGGAAFGAWEASPEHVELSAPLAWREGELREGDASPGSLGGYEVDTPTGWFEAEVEQQR